MLDKHKRYRISNIEAGCCPRCGKPSAPYYLCQSHRKYQNIQRGLYRLQRAGVVKKQDGGWVIDNDNAQYRSFNFRQDSKNFWPRLGGRPVDFDQWVLKYAQSNTPFTLEQITRDYVATRAMIAQRGKDE